MTNRPPIAMLPRLVLASASPRRRSLLAEAGYSFVVYPSDVDEEAAVAQMEPGQPPHEIARFLAELKADAVASEFPDDVILSADTVVSLDEHLLGKPEDADHARRMMQLLSGTDHQVITGVVVVRRSTNFHRIEHVISTVRMNRLTPEQIERHVASEDWRGKAGGYGIQDNDPLARSLTGCETNIVGLPMTTTRRMLESAGITPGANPP